VRVLVTGASGMVGRSVVSALVGRGDRVVALSRDPEAHPWPAGVEPVAWDARSPLPDVEADAVVNLAGQSVVGGRWTRPFVQQMRDSRVTVTRHVVEWVNAQPRPPALVSASAAGYYGSAVGPCREETPPGTGVLAELARDWEAEASRAKGRLVVLRIGHVLSPEGGYLGTILPYARLGLAGPVGGGRQPMAWVHLDDVAAAFVWGLDHPVAGTFNLASPGAAGGTQRDFAKALARAVHRPLQVPVPLWMVQLRYGAGAGPALGSGRDLHVDAIQAAGFRFRHTGLGESLRDLLA
jgi:uncharacterized protein (TIGR01777 family)